ncbi:MAG: hypothetical protein CMK07_01315 [Ponticaulis sp.]|nr:hypothetical protein [Ponticaulis sp.]
MILEIEMIEGLIFIRDILLATLLSWIGVDYQENDREKPEAPAGIQYFSQDMRAPVKLTSQIEPLKSSTGCEATLFHS